MKKLQTEEAELIGKWVAEGAEVRGDEVCERIKWLVEKALKKVGYSKEYGAWETLYQDPVDGRFWVKTYPQSEMHGGGPPALRCISDDEAKQRFDIE
ncbi:MAG: Imm27 family immunity protein [Luteolibacter sp.]